jgi:Putative zinc-finger
MAERKNNPSAHIPGSAACGQWETLLPDALDGLLGPAEETQFQEHMAVCPACTALFEESKRGQEWLEFLAPEPEVPAGLMEKILAHTGPGHEQALPLGAPMPVPAGGVPVELLGVPKWQRPGFMGFVRRFAEPRLMMTGATAFFSIALTLNMLGLRVTSVRLNDLRPAAMRSFMERQLTMASVPIIRYYDHLRFVYEVESQVRELRGNAPEGEEQDNGTPKNQQPQGGESRKNGGSGGSRVDPPKRSGTPMNGIAVEAMLDRSKGVQQSLVQAEVSWKKEGLTHSGSSESGRFSRDRHERSTTWTA